MPNEPTVVPTQRPYDKKQEADIRSGVAQRHCEAILTFLRGRQTPATRKEIEAAIVAAGAAKMGKDGAVNYLKGKFDPLILAGLIRVNAQARPFTYAAKDRTGETAARVREALARFGGTVSPNFSGVNRDEANRESFDELNAAYRTQEFRAAVKAGTAEIIPTPGIAERFTGGKTRKATVPNGVKPGRYHSMSGPIVRTGTTPEFWKNWDQVFGGKKTSSSSAKPKAAISDTLEAKRAQLAALQAEIAAAEQRDFADASVQTIFKSSEPLPPFEERVRQLFEHLKTHGVVTEFEATKMLGGPSDHRRFSRQFDELTGTLPFVARIETVAGVKRYVREGT